jgi:outer membrane protein
MTYRWSSRCFPLYLRCHRLGLLLVIMGTSGLSDLSKGSDVFGTSAQVPYGPATPLMNGNKEDPCRQDSTSSPLALFDAIERSLCESPKTRSSWAAIKAAAAGLGQSKAAYLPTLDAAAQYVHQRDMTDVSGAPALHSDYTQGVNSETISMGWVLYDFGARSASLKSSRELLLAAQASQDATLQAVFANTAKDYFGAQAANAKVRSALRIESAAGESLEAATARVNKGVAPITDRLQADTALAQAVYERAKAEGNYRTALGTLAVDMSLSADELLRIPEADQDALPNTDFVLAAHDLLEKAIQMHPKVLVAEAQWQAALSNIDVVRAKGLPTIQLVGEADRSNQPVSASLGQPELPALTRQNYIGLKIQIPLFAGFGHTYEIRQAEAEAEEQEQGLRDARQQVALSVWSSYQTLQTDTQNLRNTDVVLQSAEQAFDAAQHRYQSGVGNILELLSVLNTLAMAEQQRIQANLDWRTARLQLAASLGQLGMWAAR